MKVVLPTARPARLAQSVTHIHVYFRTSIYYDGITALAYG